MEFVAAQALGTAATAATTTAAATAATTGLFGTAGSFALMPTLKTLATVGSAIGQARAGEMQEIQYKQQVEQEKIAARDRELQRKNRLLASLATQSAVRGAQGVAMEGSPAAMMRSDIGRFEYDQLTDIAGTKMRTTSALQSGRYAKQTGYMSAATSLLDV